MESVEITAWIDTAFNGELVVPRSTIETVGLKQIAGIRARLADGNAVTMESYACILDRAAVIAIRHRVHQSWVRHRDGMGRSRHV